jgi:rubrerythrin
MPIDPKLTPWQVLGVAIRSEVDAASFYMKLQARVKNVLLAQKLKFLALEEEHHKKILEHLAADRYRGQSTEAPAGALMPPIASTVAEGASVFELFRAALGAEEAAERFYTETGERADDEGSRRILAYLGRVERSHQAMLRSEIDLLEKFPDYWNVEDFHIGQDLFHVGP